jgi:hypothetical protein
MFERHRSEASLSHHAHCGDVSIEHEIAQRLVAAQMHRLPLEFGSGTWRGSTLRRPAAREASPDTYLAHRAAA